MSWLANAIAQPFLWVGKTLIGFVGDLVKSWVYEFLILTVLKIINFLELIFSFLSVKGPNVFLFNMKSVDGRTILANNFFTHPSPLQKFYISIVAIAGVIGVVLIMIGTASYLSNKKQGASMILSPTKNFIAGTFCFTIIPVITIFLLSGVGAIAQIFSGKAPNPPSIRDIRAYQRKLPNLISKFKYGAKNNFTGSISEIYVYGLNKKTGDVEIKHGPAPWFGDYNKPNYFIAAGKIDKTKGDGNILQFQSMFNDGGINAAKKEKNTKYPHDAKTAIGHRPVSPLKEVTIGKMTRVFTYIQDMIAWGSNISSDQVNVNSLNGQKKLKRANSIENNNTLITALQTLKKRYDDLFINTKNNDIAVFGTTMKDYSKELLDVLDETNNIVALAKDEKDNDKAQKLRKNIGLLRKAQEKLSDFKIAFEDYNSKFIDIDLQNVILNGTDMSTPELRVLWTQANHLLNIKMIYDEYIKPSFTIKNGIARIGIPETLGDLIFVINELLVGSKNDTSKNGIPIALPNLKQQLSTIGDSSIAITIYQVASGQNDINWDTMPAKSDINWGNMLLGIVAGGFTVYFLLQLVIYSGIRIFEIGILFLSGPFFVMSSTVDNGMRMKNWMRLIGAKIFSIIAVVVAFSMISVGVNGIESLWKIDEGQKILETSRNINLFGVSDSHTSEWLGRNLLKLIIIISGLIAAHKGGILISSAFGVNAGIAESMAHMKTYGSAGRFFKSGVSGIAKTGKGAARGGGAAFRGFRAINPASARSREDIANRYAAIKERIYRAKADKQEYQIDKARKKMSKGKSITKLKGSELKQIYNKYANGKDYAAKAEKLRNKRNTNYFSRNKLKESSRNKRIDNESRNKRKGGKK